MTAVAITALDPQSRDAGAVAHYGDPVREQRLLTDAVGLVDRSHRTVLAVSGEDRFTWLHSLTSQHLTELKPWQGTEFLVLSPHGHVEHHAMVVEDSATTWLDLLDPATAAADQVDVLPLGRRVVGGRAVRQVGVCDEADLFEQFQRAVDGGDVDAGGGLGDLGVHLVGRGVPEFVYGLEHELTLRRQAQATLAQYLRQCV